MHIIKVQIPTTKNIDFANNCNMQKTNNFCDLGNSIYGRI